MAALRVLAVVPARAGSKGVPGKNTRLLCGQPLLAWTAGPALASDRLDRVVLSTEDQEIAELGRSLGLEVPFLRPAALATDEAPTLPVVQHAIEQLAAAGERYDAVCLLQPTSPARTVEQIDACIDLLATTGADAVVTAHPMPVEHHPLWALIGEPGAAVRWAAGPDGPPTRRQDLPPAWHRDGAVYVTRTEVVLGGSLYGSDVRIVPTDPAGGVNVDTEEDWARAEAMLRGRS